MIDETSVKLILISEVYIHKYLMYLYQYQCRQMLLIQLL